MAQAVTLAEEVALLRRILASPVVRFFVAVSFVGGFTLGFVLA